MQMMGIQNTEHRGDDLCVVPKQVTERSERFSDSEAFCVLKLQLNEPDITEGA